MIKPIQLQDSIWEISEYDKDIWDVRNLGISAVPTAYQYKLNFSFILQPWLRMAIKKFIQYSLVTLELGTCQNKLEALKRFSKFLANFYPNLASSNINREIIVEYLGYLNGRKLSADSRIKSISELKNLFEYCVKYQWADVCTEPLIYKEDYPKIPNYQPRFIPSIVLEQLNQNLSALPFPYVRMILFLQSTGVRVSEMCLMSFDCLIQSTSGNWILKFYQPKYKSEHTIPISLDLVNLIQEQQQYIRRNLGADYPYLFCANKQEGGNRRGKSLFDGYYSPNAKPPSRLQINAVLNKLAQAKNICDSSGQIWRFQSHQFRHTRFTDMINNGVPQHIVQRYANHKSPEMTCRYTHIFDQTLEKEFTKYYQNVVDIHGQIININIETETNSIAVEWLRLNIQAQALPTGFCTLPAPAQQCPYGANACLACTHFRTTPKFLPEHKEQLKRTQEAIEYYKMQGQSRIVAINESVASTLQKIIQTLET